MRLILETNQAHPKLAKAEIKELLKPKYCRQIAKGLFEVSLEESTMIFRLAYARASYEVLFSAKASNFMNKCAGTKWSEIIKTTFRIDTLAKHLSAEKRSNLNTKLQSIVYKSLKNPKVSLQNPKTSIVFIIAKNKGIACRVYKSFQGNFNSRKAHMRPGFSPVSLDPQLARACVNLLSPDTKEVVDPMCGTGGFLIEAGLMGLSCNGRDISKHMLRKSKANLDSFSIKHYKLAQENFFASKERVNYLITDLPYGRNTRLESKTGFTKAFFSKLEQVLLKRAVVILPKDVSISYLKSSKNLRVIGQHFVYIHKSLTKRILLLEKI